MRYRVRVEIEYFIALTYALPELAGFPRQEEEKLRRIYKDFSDPEAQRIKEKEKTTNHDVKAVEYFLKEKFEEYGWSAYKEFIHFGLTSQDINNTAIPLSLKEFLTAHYLPELEKIVAHLTQLAVQCRMFPCWPVHMVSLHRLPG